MRCFDPFLLVGTASFAAAHSNGLPRLTGNPLISAALTASETWQSASDIIQGSNVEKRRVGDNENTNGGCGIGFDGASCAPGYCCSSSG